MKVAIEQNISDVLFIRIGLTFTSLGDILFNERPRGTVCYAVQGGSIF